MTFKRLFVDFKSKIEILLLTVMDQNTHQKMMNLEMKEKKAILTLRSRS